MKQKLGNYAIIALVILNLIVWFAFPPVNDGRENFGRAWAGEIIGSTVIILMASALFISTRPKWAEPFFGGLDKMYLTHRRVAVSAFLLLFVHLLTVPISPKWGLGNYLAMTAFLGIVTLVLVTLSPRIPILRRLTNASYDGWRKVHRYMGIFYTLGFIHALTINALDALIAITWVQTIFIVGLVSYLYTELFGGFFKKKLAYSVDNVNRLNGNTLEIALQPRDQKLLHRAGQFLFVKFDAAHIPSEQHPFTISSTPHEENLRLTVKACGDWTQQVYEHLEEGASASIEGPHGLFNYKAGGQRQVWIAGGIGITPFLSWMRSFEADSHDREIDFFYTVRVPEEALFLDEIENASQQEGFRSHVLYSITDGRLTVDKIIASSGALDGKDIYLCGPVGMVEALQKACEAQGVPKSKLHFEEFNFR